MTVLRLLAGLCLLIAVMALVADASPWLASSGRFDATSLVAHWKQVAPASLERAEAAVVRNTGSWVWDPLIRSLIGMPTFVLFGALGILLGYLGRRRRRVNVYAN
jgi:hypothetical protein